MAKQLLGNLCKKRLMLLPVLLSAMGSAFALELGVDAGVSSSTLVDNWGAGSHIQLIRNDGWGMDAGYRYYNSITYDALNTSVNHSFNQYEASLLWQRGDRGPRLQVLAGGVYSGSWVQMAGTAQDIVTTGQLGYRAGLGISVPLFSRLRAFTEAGYQGWFSGEMPGHIRWRYGVRLTFGGTGVAKTEEQERIDTEAQIALEEDLIENPPVIIDTSVPEYIPGHLSQSLPPIVSLAELCKCFPAGPYTLQLGEFDNMPQAIRGLEYRGLRQFFNSRSYKGSPMPVFLAQSEEAGPVGLYMGELSSLEQLQYWRHELRKSGLNVRLRKVIGNKSTRVVNPLSVAEAAQMTQATKYTDEEIAKMNSLPEDWVDVGSAMPGETDLTALEYEKQMHDEKLESEREVLNKSETDIKEILANSVLQLGPLDIEKLKSTLSSEAFQEILARSEAISVPVEMKMIWDETRKEAWLSFGQFKNEQHIDEWQAWFAAEQLSAQRSTIHYQPMGDVYNFEMGVAITQYSVELDRSENSGQIIERMRSPEVLWFQAFQRINDQPVNIALNWSSTDKRYRLVVSNISNADEQELIWSNLSSVGLVPSLAEQ